MVSEAVVKRAKEGDKEAFQMLYQEVYADMYRMAYYLLQNKEDAEDAVSEAVFDMYRGIKGLRDAEAFKSWVMKILSIKCKRKMKEYNAKKTDELEGENYASKENIEQQLVMRTDIMNAMGCLKQEEQLIVVCSAVAGMNSEEIGDITGLRSATVRTKLRRALLKLRGRLEIRV